MKRKKQAIQQFINWLHQYGELPYIPIKVIYQFSPIGFTNHTCFGIFLTSCMGTCADSIYVVEDNQNKQVVMQTIAHEWGHYLHFAKGLPYCEEAAEDYAIRAMKNYRYYCKCKRKGVKINASVQ